MSKYFVSNPVSFYDDEIHKDIPLGAIAITDKKWQDLLAGQAAGKIISADEKGKPVLINPPDLTGGELIVACEYAVQNMLDTTAKSWGYDSLVSAASYANSTNPKFKAEAEILIKWRDNLWKEAYTIEAGVMPKTVNDFVAALPKAPIKPVI